MVDLLRKNVAVADVTREILNHEQVDESEADGPGAKRRMLSIMSVLSPPSSNQCRRANKRVVVKRSANRAYGTSDDESTIGGSKPVRSFMRSAPLGGGLEKRDKASEVVLGPVSTVHHVPLLVSHSVRSNRGL